MNKACERCAKRKAKCSGTLPCERCVEASASCSYQEAQRRGPKRKHKDDRGRISTARRSILDESVSSSSTPSAINLTRDSPLPNILRDQLHDLCQAFVAVSWPVIYTPALPSLASLEVSRPILYNAILLSCTAIVPNDVRLSIAPTREYLLNIFNRHLETQGGLSCSEPNLPLIQALLFATSYFVGAGKMILAWNYCGLACRLALSMSLHQSPRLSGKKQQGRIEEQEERRTFWGLYIMEQVVSYLLRLPPMLRAEDADRELPDVEEKDEYELWLNEHPQTFISRSQVRAMVGVRTHTLSSFLAWVQVMKEHEAIRKDLRRDLPSGTGAFEHFYAERSQRLQAFKDQLPAHLQWSSPFLDPEYDWNQSKDFDKSFALSLQSHSSVAPQILLMRAWYSECCILLHRPCVNEGHQGSLSAKHCLCAAMEICTIVSAYDEAFGINMMQSGFVHIIFQSATLLAAMESVYKICGPHFWTPSLPDFPIGDLLDKCFLWLQTLSIRFPLANHYVSILASLSKAQPITNSQVPFNDRHRGLPLPSIYEHSTDVPHIPHSFEQVTSNPTVQEPIISAIPDDFWDIAPFDGENLNEWLRSVEAFVPNQ